MTFFFLSIEAESLTHAIHEFQYDTSNKIAFCINLILKKLVDCVAATKLINPPLVSISKKKTRVATSASSYFYNSSWLTNVNKFPRTVAYFDKITANSQIIDFSF